MEENSKTMVSLIAPRQYAYAVQLQEDADSAMINMKMLTQI